MLLNVMIVDDEPSNIYGLVRYINWQELGYELPITAESGEEALAILAESPCDVLISDVSMPGMNGIELVARAKEIHPQLQVMMISGYNEFEFVQDAIQVGAQAYVLKPLKPEEVSGMLTTFRNATEKMRRIIEQTVELEQKISGNLKLLKERFVSDLISGLALTEDLIASWSDLLPLPDCRARTADYVVRIRSFYVDGQGREGTDATRERVQEVGRNRTVRFRNALSDADAAE